MSHSCGQNTEPPACLGVAWGEEDDKRGQIERERDGGMNVGREERGGGIGGGGIERRWRYREEGEEGEREERAGVRGRNKWTEVSEKRN